MGNPSFYFGEDADTASVPTTFAAGPTTGFTANFSASRAAAYASGRTDSREMALRQAYDPITDALNADISKASGFSMAPDGSALFRNPYRGREFNPALDAAGGVPIEEQRIWAEIQRRRQAGNPKFLPDVGKDRDDFVARLDAKARTATEQAGQMSEHASFLGDVGGLVGGITGTFTDPPNLAALLLGAGPAKTIVGTALREAGVNAGFTAATLPGIAQRRSEIGAPMTASEALEDVGGAAVLGFGVAGAIHAGGHLVTHFRGKPIEALTDGELAVASHDIPNATPDVHSAGATLAAKTEVDTANPHADTPQGQSAHYAALSDAQHALTADDFSTIPSAPPPPADVTQRLATFTEPAGEGQRAQIAALQHDIDATLKPQPETPSASAPAGQPPRAAAPSDARPIEQKIAMHESGGDPTATNPGKGQTASGLGGITNPTWLGLWKKYVGAEGMTDAQILAKKADAAMQRQMLGYAVQEDRSAVRAAGLPETDANTFAIHFLGTRDGTNLLRADPLTPVSDFLPRKVIAANKSILEGRTAGDVRAWAAKAMGEQPEVPAPRMVAVGEEIADGEPVPVQRPLDELMAEHDADDTFISNLQACLA